MNKNFYSILNILNDKSNMALWSVEEKLFFVLVNEFSGRKDLKFITALKETLLRYKEIDIVAKISSGCDIG